MFNRKQIIESNKEPQDKNVIWLHNVAFKKWTSTGWKPIINDTSLLYSNLLNKPKINGVILDGNMDLDYAHSVSLSYKDLVLLRDTKKLVPGRSYRITDYDTIISESVTDARSAHNRFDIIVKALTESVLSEEAKAIQNSKNSYFDNSKLNVWRIWYCLDNDTSRFSWADTSKGKGVIYRMIDEFNNDLPYDFKNIQFKRTLGVEFTTDNKTIEWCNRRVLQGLPVGWLVFDNNPKFMDDLHRTRVNGQSSNQKWFYTFWNNDLDATLLNQVHNVKMQPNYTINNYKHLLNNNIFIVTNTKNEVRNVYLGYYNYNNSFRGVKDVNFGNSCAENILGDISNIKFGNECYLNIINGNNVILGNQSSYNTLGSNIILGNKCSYNSLFYNEYVTLGNGCEMISNNNTSYDYIFATIGDYCKRIEGKFQNNLVLNPYTTDQKFE